MAASPRRRGSTKESRHAPTKKTIALVYDFDGTLSPKPMQEYSFLPQLGIKAADFWAECTAIARKESADPLITYMHLMYKKAKEKGLRIDRKDLVAQGKQVELYPGVKEWFGEIDGYVKKRGGVDGLVVKHYLVSSGLTEIIEGTPIYKNFARVFASEYWFDAYDLPFPKRVITDTGKTQYLFRINKGLEDQFESINAHMPEAARPVPFSNMIYFGDGETDVPSMALLKKNGGAAIAVHGRSFVGALRLSFLEPGPERAGKKGAGGEHRRAGRHVFGRHRWRSYRRSEVHRTLPRRPLRFLRRRRLPQGLRSLQAHVPAPRPHHRGHPRAG